MLEEDEFEILKKQAEGLEVPVRDNVWQNISSRLGKPGYLNARFKNVPIGLAVSLVVGFSLLYTVERSKQENVSTASESHILTDTVAKNYSQADDNALPGTISSGIATGRSEINFEVGEKLVVNGTGIKWGETGNRYKADDTIREVIDFKLIAIPIQPCRPFELSRKYRNNGIPHKLEAIISGTKRPQKGIIFSSFDFGIGTNFWYAKKQPETSSLLDQSYLQHINYATEKSLPLSAKMMANAILPRGLSVATGLQFFHFRERVTYDVKPDSILVLVDDGQGGFDTNTYYYDYSVPGLGFSIESRTSLFQLPVMLNLSYKLHKNFNAELNAGINIGLYSIHRSKSEHGHIPGIVSFIMRQDHSTFFYSLGAQASAGLEYRISHNSGIALKLNYYRSFRSKIPSFNLIQQSLGSELVYRLNIR